MIKNIEKILNILEKELSDFQNPLVSQKKWEIINKTPFTTLISCLLSLRTKDEVTDKASMKLFKKYDTPQKLSKADIKEIEKLIYPVGFYHVKAKRIKNISKTLIEEYDGKVPEDFKELLKLNGVGRKTANIVMTYGFNQKKFLPIDTHCHRIPNRLGWIKTRTPDETEKQLKKILPKKHWHKFNRLFVKFGQNICLPISPKCSICPVEKYCKKINVNKHR
jgi:endonuclease III